MYCGWAGVVHQEANMHILACCARDPGRQEHCRDRGAAAAPGTRPERSAGPDHGSDEQYLGGSLVVHYLLLLVVHWCGFTVE